MRSFKRYPALTAAAALLALTMGVVLGHRSELALPARQLSMSIGTAASGVGPPDALARAALAHAKPSAGRLVQELESGSRVVFTVDPALQRRAIELLQKHAVPYGAIVIYDLESGATLALAGHAESAPELTAHELCLRPWSPAASVFKLVSASALLARGVPSSTSVCYHGGLHGLALDHLRSDPRLDRSCETLRAGVARSLNPVLAKLVDKHLDPAALSSWSERFGFNRPLPFDLASEPSRADIPRERLEFARAAAGFWHTEISPLHGAILGGIAATGGLLKWPHAVERVVMPDGRRHEPRRHAPERILAPAIARELAQMMVDTVRVGTARRAFADARGRALLAKARVGGKTGSLSRTNPFLDYSWFVGFATNEQRRVAFSVLLGNPPRWRIKASAAAAELLAYLFARGA